jgi:hypothetical protein
LLLIEKVVDLAVLACYFLLLNCFVVGVRICVLGLGLPVYPFHLSH